MTDGDIMNITRNLVVAVLMTVVTTLHARGRLSAGDHRHRAGPVPDQANGQLIERNGKVDRFAAHRAGILVAGLLPAPAFGRRHGLRRRQFRRHQPRADQQKLIDAVTANVEAARRRIPNAPVPIDLVTTSASGLDPHISPAAADFQVPRVARERGTSEADVRGAGRRRTPTGRQLGLPR